MKSITATSFKQLKAKALKDSSFKKEYVALGPKYEEIRIVMAK